MFLYYVLIFQMEFKKTVKMGQTFYKQSWKKSSHGSHLSEQINTWPIVTYVRLNRVDGSRRSQVVAQAGSKKHVTLVGNSKEQCQIESNTWSLVVVSSSKSYFISDEDAVIRWNHFKLCT